VKPDDLIILACSDPRSQQDMLDSIKLACSQQYVKDQDATASDEGVTLLASPFWEYAPHTDFHAHACQVDVLHQLLKGIFKDHLVQWCLMFVPENILDA